jgi:hypothetical protein
MLLAALGLGLCASPSAAQEIREINPTTSTLHSTSPNGASGGRVNKLATVRGNNRIFYAASEWGGLYKSTDRGLTWERLDGHLPAVTWDVKVSPADANLVYATSFYDGRVKSLAGINVSRDGGVTWTHPETALPPEGFCKSPARRNEPSAFGIAIDPDNSSHVYIGTNCGLAISHDAGATWRYVDPTPETPATAVWSVVVHHGGIIDLCGSDGHRRSVDGGNTWTTASANGKRLSSGRCSIAVSPDEPHVLFAVVGTSIFESDDAGATWATQFENPKPQGRIPFVATNKRSAGFDLWFGDVSLYRATCATPKNPVLGGKARCPPSTAWAGPFTRTVGGHDDMGDIAFDTEPQAAGDACPVLMSSDGGVYYNTKTVSPDCQTPAWRQPMRTPRALWLFGMGGARQPGAKTLHLYFGAQDNGTFVGTAGGTQPPPWENRECCDSTDIATSPGQVLYTGCCYSSGRKNRLYLRKADMTGGGQIKKYPPGEVPRGRWIDVVDNFGPNRFVLLTTEGAFVTADITANPIVWKQLGKATTPADACGVKVAFLGKEPVFYVQTGSCSSSSQDRLWRYAGTAASGSWQEVRPPNRDGGFGIFDVARLDANRLIASHITDTGVQMILSANGGAEWRPNPALDALMTGSGTWRYRSRLGPAPTRSTSFDGYAQPTLVAFSAADANILVAGGADSGLFLSRDAGATWSVVTKNDGTPASPHIPRPRFAYFDREEGVLSLYVGTQGRGVWRVRLPESPTAQRQ